MVGSTLLFHLLIGSQITWNLEQTPRVYKYDAKLRYQALGISLIWETISNQRYRKPLRMLSPDSELRLIYTKSANQCQQTKKENVMSRWQQKSMQFLQLELKCSKNKGLV